MGTRTIKTHNRGGNEILRAWRQEGNSDGWKTEGESGGNTHRVGRQKKIIETSQITNHSSTFGLISLTDVLKQLLYKLFSKSLMFCKKID